MFVGKALAAVLTAAGVLFQDAIAHSVKRNPLSSIARIEDAVIQTPSHRVHAHSSFDVTFVLSTTHQKVRLSLQPNHDLFSGDATIQYLGVDGTVRSSKPIDRREHRVFRGESFVQLEAGSEWRHAGWSRINVRRDGEKPIFDGVFTIYDNHHHIQTKTAYRQTSVSGDPGVDDIDNDEYMVVWRDTDVQPRDRDELRRDLGSAATCGSDDLLYNRDENNIVYRSLEEAAQDTTSWRISPRALFGRQIDSTPGGNGAGVNLANSIGSTAGCPTTRKVALVGIATDCTYTDELGDEDAVTSNVIQVVNAASQLYESSFNISLAIGNLTISEATCPNSPPSTAPWNQPCSDSVPIQNRLSLFSQWRGQWSDNNAYWTLLSMCGTGPAVGLAWLGAICQQGASVRDNETSASANLVVRTSPEWLVFAHETGHTFGAVHDCVDQTCSDGSVTRQECCPLSRGTCDAGSQFVMNPSTGNGITRFSPCSIGNICSFLGRSPNRLSCLTDNRGVTTYTGAQCGNGIVEHGEDCDCGGEDGCAGNTCCDPTTCRFTSGSVCDPSNEECCTPQCGFMNNGTVCRASTGPCDPEEVCSGTSAGCPADQTAPDGQSCGSDGLTCASGRCTSRDLQCRTFMGADATTSCSNSGCRLSCHSSQLGPNECYIYNQYFLDGTPCEGGGRCSNGNCQGGSLWNQIVEWINDNKQISIPVFCVAGGLLLLAIISCCWTCFARRRRRRIPKVPSPSPPRGWAAGGGGGRTPPPMAQPRAAYAPVPGQDVPPQDMRWEPLRTRSFRYA
ncbi:Metallo-peptidase family M12-domain-containing protein [Achaetomium macrosporum]|uniref:Disintegrin and metalloproteinase domain-containing protein B n=1 Tax=Achaetomium macrosporum TaxID=79813 RepID=A0AAN7CIB4_9PEZI|nr:Metallo-peptidase family M12-domain-containing protein [Achaetomium macrosporum]